MLCRGGGKAPGKHTFGIQKWCRREHTGLCACDLVELEEAHALLPVAYSVHTQMRCQTFLLLLPWRQWNCEVWETCSSPRAPRVPKAPAYVGKSVRSYAKNRDTPSVEERLTWVLLCAPVVDVPNIELTGRCRYDDAHVQIPRIMLQPDNLGFALRGGSAPNH